MLPKSHLQSYAGYVGLSVVVFMLMLSMLIFPYFFPSGGTEGECQAGEPPDEGEEIVETWPAIDGGETGLPVEEQPTNQFKLIRKNVPVTSFLTVFNPGAWSGNQGTDIHIIGIQYLDENRRLMYPKKNFGEHTIEPVNGKPQRGVHLFGEGLAFVMHMDGPSTPTILTLRPGEGPGGETEEAIRVVDVYQLVDKAVAVENGEAQYTHDELFQCDGGGPLPSAPAGVVVPTQENSMRKDQLQMEWILFNPSVGVWGTHCKPAVYLYPRVRSLVNVRVYPKGELTYTDPVYDPARGWTVWAEPDGGLEVAFSPQSSAVSKFDYLYYESKLFDSEIRKPQEGWVVRSGEMAVLLDRILPQLGLNEKEKADFENYWLGKLPESPYYFVGLIDKSQRDYLEALDVTPVPETSIRFSLFFEQMDQFKVVKEPVIVTPKREGFTLVDWGGMIKLHPGTPFTCSQ